MTKHDKILRTRMRLVGVTRISPESLRWLMAVEQYDPPYGTWECKAAVQFRKLTQAARLAACRSALGTRGSKEPTRG